MPPDARKYADQEVVVQDLVIRPNSICYRQEVWYSPSLDQFFYGELPDAAQQTFGAGLRSAVVTFKFVGQMSEANLRGLLDEAFGKNKGGSRRNYFDQAGALSYYHGQSAWPVPAILLSDDADQFKRITEHVALCWIHEGRHYEKLEPLVPLHREQLEHFRRGYWYYYRRLQDYRAGPEPGEALELAAEFDVLFSTRTGYAALGERIALTQAKRDRLLVVLSFPTVLLHNNTSELGARVCARRRDVSLHCKSVRGAATMDLFNTLVQTAKKLGVNAYHYFLDRISGRCEMPSLAELILRQSVLPTHRAA